MTTLCRKLVSHVVIFICSMAVADDCQSSIIVTTALSQKSGEVEATWTVEIRNDGIPPTEFASIHIPCKELVNPVDKSETGQSDDDFEWQGTRRSFIWQKKSPPNAQAGTYTFTAKVKGTTAQFDWGRTNNAKYDAFPAGSTSPSAPVLLPVNTPPVPSSNVLTVVPEPASLFLPCLSGLLLLIRRR